MCLTARTVISTQNVVWWRLKYRHYYNMGGCSYQSKLHNLIFDQSAPIASNDKIRFTHQMAKK